MRDLYYEKQGNSTYLVYDVKEEDSIDSMSLGMLTNNNIHGLAQTLYTQMNSRKFIKFNVSAKVSAAQFFAGAVNRKRLLGIFSGIVNAMLAAEDYMLDPASVIMDLEYIFTDVSTCETDLICIPVVHAETDQPDLGMFFRNIMFNTQFDQTENCDHVAKIINYLNGTPLFSLTDFKNVLEEIQGEKEQPAIRAEQSGTKMSLDAKQPKKHSEAARVRSDPYSRTRVSPDHSLAESMKIPPAQKKTIPETQTGDASKSTESEISFFYLMQHYNKENAAAYKAQKEARKRASAARKGKGEALKIPDKKTQAAEQPSDEFGFAVPGLTHSAEQVSSQVAEQKITTPAQRPAYAARQEPQNDGADFGETTILIEATTEGTTLLISADVPERKIAPYLIRKKNNEKISLNKPVFRVGKEKSYVDCFISDNAAISRSHANFITRDGEYFVVDTNSTNHTFVNGFRIQSNVETAISHGDTIRLANEDFEFKLY